jgi:hypothetical protein
MRDLIKFEIDFFIYIIKVFIGILGENIRGKLRNPVFGNMLFLKKSGIYSNMKSIFISIIRVFTGILGAP